MIQHAFFTRLLPPVLAISALMTQPALSAECTEQAVAEVYSHTGFGMASMMLTFDQSAALRRVSEGAGYDGDWVVTEWTILTTLPRAVKTSPDAMYVVPEWDADCTSARPDPSQVLHECKGEIPLEIKDSVISWKGGPRDIGSIAAGSGGKATMRLNILPDEGAFDWTMTGPVSADPAPVITPEIFADRMVTKSGVTGHEITIDVRLTPAPLEMVNTLTLETSYIGTGIAPSTGTTTQTKQGGEITLTIWGDTPKARFDSTLDTELVVEVERAGCTFSKRWQLTNLFVASGHTP